MLPRNFTNNDIARYYSSSQWLYRLFIYDTESLGMHFGFWSKTTKTLQEALTLENNTLTKLAEVKHNMNVLDAGCGVGGTALYIAKQTGAKVWGITITPSQIALANKYASDRGLEGLVSFSIQDYTKTTFRDNFFDVIVGIESICHVSPKSKFLIEAHRILKPGGKLVIADGYLARNPQDDEERKIVDDFMWAFSLNEFISAKEMSKQIKIANFVKVQSKDMLKSVAPSIARFRNLTNKVKILGLAAKYIPSNHTQAMYKNYIALARAVEGYEMDLAAYYIHLAQKPKK